MRKASKYRGIFVLLSLLLAIEASLGFSGVGFAQEENVVINEENKIKNDTLSGKPNCVNYGTIETDGNNRRGMYVTGEDHYASNFGKVITHGHYAYGIYAYDGSTANNWGA